MSYLEDIFSLKGKVAIVTGGARGNGKSIAESLLRAGSEVFICDRLKEETKATVDEFKKLYEGITGFVCDLSIQQGLDEFVDKIKIMDKIDILVNNAGITRGNDIFDYTIDDWRETIKVNLEVPFVLSKVVGGIMKKNGSGSIINITSLNAEQGFSGNPAYVASKGGLKQLSKALAMDLGKYGIRVNNIGPGYFITNMTSKSWGNEKTRKDRADRTILNRWGKPEDLRGLVILLSSDASQYITGQDIYVDGGWLAKGV